MEKLLIENTDFNNHKSFASREIKMKIHLAVYLVLIPFTTLSQSITQSTFNSIGTSFQTSYAGMDINVGEPITGPISSNNNIITQGLLQPSINRMNIKIYFEGFYFGNGLMDNSGFGGCLYKVGASTNYNDVDSLRLTLVDKVTLSPMETATSIININGLANFKFNSSVENSYYLKLNHRNSIETWSAIPVYLQPENSYDFTTSKNKAYGGNQILTFDSLGWAIYSGDISDAATTTLGLQDGIVESQDYSDMESAVPTTLLGYHTEDITGDGVVESEDYGLMENNVYYTRVIVKP